MNGVRTAQDIERKYNLSEMGKNIELAEDKIFKVNNELTNFTNSVTSQFEAVQTSIDGKAEIWFYSGAPSLSNPPANSWEDFSMHVGDLYYDTNTGYAYRFKVADSVYSWEQVQDQDTVESLALANSAVDTADSKRRVFLETPTTPYDNGDLWINNQELYVCQTARETGEYTEGDFAIATKYTDDTVANEVASALSEVRESVTFLNGSEGGIFRPIDSNGDGINDGFILADRTDAVLPPDAKCLVANYEGIGFSQDGGDSYSIALKHDGVAGNWSFSGSQAIDGTNIKGYVANIANSTQSFGWNSQGLLFYDKDTLPQNDPPQFGDMNSGIGAIRFQQTRADEGMYRGNTILIQAKKSTNQGGSGTSSIYLSADRLVFNDVPYGGDGWKSLNYFNGWHNRDDAPYENGQFQKVDGVVIMQGLISGGSTTLVPAFLLPEGYRPSKRLIFPMLTGSGMGRLFVQDDGYCIPDGIGKEVWSSLSNIQFYVG